MQKIKVLFTALLAGGLAFFLLFMGLGLILAWFVIMVLASLFVKPQTRHQWRQRWAKNWQARQAWRHSSVNHSQKQATKDTSVIEGQCRVIEP